jgi:hypothetical protein
MPIPGLCTALSSINLSGISDTLGPFKNLE